MKQAVQPIIVVRRNKRRHAHHGGAWKVAYADFVTAMMAFFLVMWLCAQDSRVRTAIAGYFRDPGLLPHEQSNSLLGAGRGGISGEGTPMLSMSKADGLLDAERNTLVAAADRIRQDMMQFGLESLRDQVEFSVTAEGLRIELVDEKQSSFFDTGSSVLRGDSERILSVIAGEIAKLPNDVVVEGHTDSAGYLDGKRYDNWNLSADRANAARRVMVEHGLLAWQLKGVRGFADTELRLKGSPLDPRNRRISIVVRSLKAAALDSSLRGVTGPGKESEQGKGKER